MGINTLMCSVSSDDDSVSFLGVLYQVSSMRGYCLGQIGGVIDRYLSCVDRRYFIDTFMRFLFVGFVVVSVVLGVVLIVMYSVDLAVCFGDLIRSLCGGL